MGHSSVVYTVNNGVGEIILNEPDSRNALSSSIKQGLLDSLFSAEADPEVKVIVLTGRGKGFCAGGDIKDMGNRTVIETVDKMDQTTRIPIKIQEIQKPIIAAVNGYAMGAGFSIALACDIIFADESSKFGLSFSKIGLVPDCGLLYYLPRLLGPWKTKELIFNGEVLSAIEAKNYGIVNRLVPTGSVMDEANSYAEELARGPVQAMKFVKTILKETINQDLSGTIKYENYAQSMLQQTDDHREGIQAFKEKRSPNFQGK